MWRKMAACLGVILLILAVMVLWLWTPYSG